MPIAIVPLFHLHVLIALLQRFGLLPAAPLFWPCRRQDQPPLKLWNPSFKSLLWLPNEGRGGGFW